MRRTLRSMSSLRTPPLSASTRLDPPLVHNLTRDMWDEYSTVMNNIMNSHRVIKKTSASLLPGVQSYLLEESIETVNSRVGTPSTMEADLPSFRQDSREMYQSFVQSKGWNKAQTDYLERCLSYTADWCAKKQLVAPAIVAWYKVRETYFVPRQNTFSTYMFVLGLPFHNQKLAKATLADVCTFYDGLFEPTERTVFLRIQGLVEAGDADKAEQLLQTIPDCQKLRTFLPILEHYGRTDIPNCLRIFRQMRKAAGVHFDVETYVSLFASLAEKGYFGTQPPPVNKIMLDAGFGETGPALFDALASEMADDILEFSESNALTLYNALETALDPPSMDPSQLTTPKAELDVLPNATELTSATDASTLLGRVTVDAQSCRCPASHAKLQLFSLSEEQRQHVNKTLLEMASSEHEEFAAKMQKQGRLRRRNMDATSGAYAMEQLNGFSKWVAQQNYTAIIDGPNVAYFGHSMLHYSQVARMVEHLENLGERPLVIMPHKYCQKSFHVTTINDEQHLSDRERQLIVDLKEKDQLYIVPEWCLDDYYWMIASVVVKSEVSANQACLPGLRPLLITNDKMRDHHMSLLEPRLFRRWTSCHIVRYDFEPYEGDEWVEERKVLLEHADFFSHEIQGNVALNGATAWHIPVAEWSEEFPHDRFCISIGGKKV